MTTPVEELVTFTVRIHCSEVEAQRLNKVLQDAGVMGTGHWGYETTREES